VSQAVSLCVAWQHITVDHALGSFETIFKGKKIAGHILPKMQVTQK